MIKLSMFLYLFDFIMLSIPLMLCCFVCFIVWRYVWFKLLEW